MLYVWAWSVCRFTADSAEGPLWEVMDNTKCLSGRGLAYWGFVVILQYSDTPQELHKPHPRAIFNDWGILALQYPSTKKLWRGKKDSKVSIILLL